MHPEDQRKAITWAFLAAKARGWDTKREGSMIWVDTGSSEIGCSSDMDFVSYMSEKVRS